MFFFHPVLLFRPVCLLVFQNFPPRTFIRTHMFIRHFRVSPSNLQFVFYELLNQNIQLLHCKEPLILACFFNFPPDHNYKSWSQCLILILQNPAKVHQCTYSSNMVTFVQKETRCTAENTKEIYHGKILAPKIEGLGLSANSKRQVIGLL